MPATTALLINESLWRQAKRLLRDGQHLRAAIAYFGQKGATLLPFRKGQHLVVDLSIPSVRAGRSDPREVEKLLHRGVVVFSRANLHAKIIASDRETLVGSANVSNRAANLLDEAAALTSDPAAVRRAREFIESLSNEPVRPEYLALLSCL
jgi:phosphatidylserine/phosphatidylglycerophosphate/cardiolipin synthase-like enzyme